MSEVNGKLHPALEHVSLGIGTWQWGDQIYWGFGRGYKAEDLRAAFDACLAAGMRFFDTAEVYGQGRSETYLGKFSQETNETIEIATKFMPYPWRLRRSSLLKALRNSLKRLERSQVELYQIHQPLPPVRVETWMESMIDAVQAGLIKAVGVSNYDASQTQRAYAALLREGIQLASNQVEYNLLNRSIETNGLLKRCQEMGVVVIAYSPLAQGLLTGKYTSENPPQGFRGRNASSKTLAKIQPLISLLRRIGADHAGKTPAQVAINWVMCKSAIPIPGVKNAAQVEQNLGALGWKLSDAEVAGLDEMSDRVAMT